MRRIPYTGGAPHYPDPVPMRLRTSATSCDRRSVYRLRGSLLGACVLSASIAGCGLSVDGLPPELSGAARDVGADTHTAANDAAQPDTEQPVDWGVWTPWALVLERHSRGSCFDYDGLMDDPEAMTALADAVAVFAELDATTLESADAQRAYWFNAYNTFMVQTVVDGYAVYEGASILLPFEGQLAFRAERWEASGRTLALNYIEHAILREDLEKARLDPGPLADDLLALGASANAGEPFDVRLHFALNCASVGCPDLRPEPYIADQLDAQLEAQTVAFLNNPRKGAGLLGISDLLLGLYPDDFEREAGSVVAYVHRYNPEADGAQRITYDWALNGCE